MSWMEHAAMDELGSDGVTETGRERTQMWS